MGETVLQRTGAIASCVLLASIAILSACSGSPQKNEPTPGASSAIATVTAPAGTPDTADVTVVAGTYTFPGKGYAITIPDGWQARTNLALDVSSVVFPSDNFFSANSTGDVQPSVTVSCMKPQAAQATTQDFADHWRAFVKQLLQKDVAPAPARLGGKPAAEFDYAQNQSAGGTAEANRTDILLATDRCRWMVTELAPANPTTELVTQLHAIASSVRFIP